MKHVKAVGEGRRAVDPRRDEAFLLFASGSKYARIAKILHVSPQTLTGWRKADDWDSRIKAREEEYRRQFTERSATVRATRDSAALDKLLALRENLIGQLGVKAGDVKADTLATALKAVQDVIDRIAHVGAPDDPGGEGAGLPDVAGVRFVNVVVNVEPGALGGE